MAAGKDPATLTGWQHQGDSTQFFDRKPYEIDGKAYEIAGKTRRPEKHESAFGRREMMPGSEGQRGFRPPRGKYPPIDDFSEPLRSYYKEFPDVYEADKLRQESVMPKNMMDRYKYGKFYKLIDAFSDAWHDSEPITSPPEVSDFTKQTFMGPRKVSSPVKFKSPELASKLIKKVTRIFGASMVGITKLNPDWCYNYDLRGSEDRGSYEVPKHREYVIAFGVPHQWEQVMSNPNMGTSFDAYARMTLTARRLERYIKALGYPARRHSPMDGYDVIGVPIVHDAGLGMQGRHGIVITPETGSNFRSA